jgi:hypothetical protein
MATTAASSPPFTQHECRTLLPQLHGGASAGGATIALSSRLSIRDPRVSAAVMASQLRLRAAALGHDGSATTSFASPLVGVDAAVALEATEAIAAAVKAEATIAAAGMVGGDTSPIPYTRTHADADTDALTSLLEAAIPSKKRRHARPGGSESATSPTASFASKLGDGTAGAALESHGRSDTSNALRRNASVVVEGSHQSHVPGDTAAEDAAAESTWGAVSTRSSAAAMPMRGHVLPVPARRGQPQLPLTSGILASIDEGDTAETERRSARKKHLPPTTTRSLPGVFSTCAPRSSSSEESETGSREDNSHAPHDNTDSAAAEGSSALLATAPAATDWDIMNDSWEADELRVRAELDG